MFSYSPESLTSYIERDNEDSLKIYTDLVSAHKKSLHIYPIETNIMGIYFIDILKILTLTLFKEKELNFGIEPNGKFVNRKLDTWPYIGYDDIRYGCKKELKVFGKNPYVKQKITRIILQELVNFRFLIRQPSINVTLASPKIDYGSNLLWSEVPNIKTNLINMKRGWFAVPKLNEQIELLKDQVVKVMKKNNYTFSADLMAFLIENHIRADCSEGRHNAKFKSDVLILRCGNELNNRMLSVAAIQQNIPVVNIMHGEGFGVYDEPIASEYGEQMYSSAILGYGNRITSIQDTYKFKIKKGVSYIPSNGVNAYKYYQPEFLGIKHNKKINYYYYPTTLRGASHRFGPYMDTVDSLYLLWQKSLFTMFGDSIQIKAHPIEKYSMSYSFPMVETVEGSFKELLNKIDVFVFDFIGTAFNEACATNKPIIYFDLGIKNINSDALIWIKERTIYFDIKKGLPSMKEIQERVRFSPMENTYSDKFSLCGTDQSRAESLRDGIINFL